MCQDNNTQEKKQYVVFVENCRKDNMVLVNYLQYTGNEAEIAKLHKVVSDAEEEGYELYGDLSSFEMKIQDPIPEDAVDVHLKQDLGYYLQLRKIDGNFVCPFDLENEDSWDLSARGLDEMFYRGQIRCYFQN